MLKDMLLPEPGKEWTQFNSLVARPKASRDETWRADLRTLLSSSRLIPTIDVALVRKDGITCLNVSSEARVKRQFLVERGAALIERGWGVAIHLRDNSVIEVFSNGAIHDFMSLGLANFEFNTIRRGVQTPLGRQQEVDAGNHFIPFNEYTLPTSIRQHIASFLKKSYKFAEPKAALAFRSNEVPNFTLFIEVPAAMPVEQYPALANGLGFYLRKSMSIALTPKTLKEFQPL